MAKVEFFYFLGHEQFQPEVLVEHAVLAEKAGFDGLLVSEHFHPWVDDAGAAGFAWSTLGAIAAKTKKVKLMTGVTTPLFRYHPALVAQAAATVDRLSGGRFMLGVGTGENINEGPLGYEFGSYVERASRMKEGLEIIERLLGGDKLTYKGEYYNTDRAKLYSPPVGSVPVLMAAGGPKSAELAGRMAAGVVVSVKNPGETVEQVLEPARLEAGESGKSFLVLATKWSVLAKDNDEAWEVLKPWRGLRAPGRLEAVDPMELRLKADDLSRDEVLGRYSVVSACEALVDVYKPLVSELGADIVGIQITSPDPEKTIGVVGELVLPELRGI